MVLLFFVLVWVGFSTPWGRGCGIIWLMHEVRRGKLWLDANVVSASPKGQRPAAKRGLDFDNPFSRSKTKEPSVKLGSFILYTELDEDPRRGAD